MNGSTIFITMIFVTVFLLAQGLVVPVFGESARARKRLQERLQQLDGGDNEPSYSSMVRQKHLRKLTSIERALEELPMLTSLAGTIEQAGYSMLAYRLVLLSAVLAATVGLITWYLVRLPLPALGLAVIAFAAPIVKVRHDRNKRISKFEEQLPDAIDIMRRALKAGHPFSSTLKLVSQDMDAPVAKEFEITFNDISYGNNTRRAMLGLLTRVPSVTVMALVTSILVQKETGGNLAEVLEQIAKVIRGRFRFHRKVKTFTAEGRMSAWVLALVPLILFAAIWVTTPDYLPMMTEDPRGQKLIMYAFISGAAGVVWIRRIIRIEV
jgi:tight adherence protein B